MKYKFDIKNVIVKGQISNHVLLIALNVCHFDSYVPKFCYFLFLLAGQFYGFLKFSFNPGLLRNDLLLLVTVCLFTSACISIAFLFAVLNPLFTTPPEKNLLRIKSGL